MKRDISTRSMQIDRVLNDGVSEVPCFIGEVADIIDRMILELEPAKPIVITVERGKSTLTIKGVDWTDGIGRDHFSTVIGEDSDFVSTLKTVAQSLKAVLRHNFVVKNPPKVPEHFPKIVAVDANIDNWVMTASPCLVYEPPRPRPSRAARVEDEDRVYNLVRLHNKTRKKKTLKSERTKADDAKIKVYFTIDSKAWESQRSQDLRTPEHLYDHQRMVLDIEATARSAKMFIREGDLPFQLFNRLVERLTLDDKFHKRLWRKPVNTTGCGEYETFKVIPVVETDTRIRYMDYEVTGIGIHRSGYQHIHGTTYYKKVSDRALQDPKNVPALVFVSKGKRLFFVERGSAEVQMLPAGRFGGRWRDNKSDVHFRDYLDPEEWRTVDSMDTFLTHKIRKSLRAWLKGSKDD